MNGHAETTCDVVPIVSYYGSFCFRIRYLEDQVKMIQARLKKLSTYELDKDLELIASKVELLKELESKVLRARRLKVSELFKIENQGIHLIKTDFEKIKLSLQSILRERVNIEDDNFDSFMSHCISKLSAVEEITHRSKFDLEL